MGSDETTRDSPESQVGYVSTPMWVRAYYWRRRLVEATGKTKSCDIGPNTHDRTHPGTLEQKNPVCTLEQKNPVCTLEHETHTQNTHKDTQE